jgi:hypothetical protein
MKKKVGSFCAGALELWRGVDFCGAGGGARRWWVCSAHFDWWHGLARAREDGRIGHGSNVTQRNRGAEEQRTEGN